jgi:hypothetical protein
MGAALQEMAQMDRDELAAAIAEMTLAQWSREFAMAETASADPACTDMWKTALARYRDEFLSHAARPEFFLPVDFHGRGSIESGYEALQAFLLDFARLISSWPAVWDRARGMNPYAR